MQFSALIAQAGGTPQSLEVQADVTLGPDKGDGGQFEAAAQAAKATCPISKALTGVAITLDATLES